MSVDELVAGIDGPDLRVVDCRWYLLEPERGQGEYRRGHVPGAVYGSLDVHLSGMTGPGRHPLPAPGDFAAAMASLGIDRSHHVVAYDDSGGAIAARLWWMLTAQGFERVSVLDGGIPAWREAGHAVSSDTPHIVPTEPFAARPWTGVVTIETVAEREGQRTVLDARSADRYRGDGEQVDPKAGHIPGAVSLPLTDLLDERDRLLDATSIARRFAEAGVTADSSPIAQCGSGVTACHLILAAEVAGLPKPDLYVGSWSEWSSTDRPVTVGDAP